MFDVDQFIECIQERPVLWDRRRKEYSGKTNREEAWKEIGSVMYKKWYSLNSEEKDEKVKELKKKWRNIRDNFQKFLNQQDDGVSAKKKKYVYADNLMFLQNTLMNRKTTENSWADDFDDDQEKKEIEEVGPEEKIKGSGKVSEKEEFGEEDKSNSSSSRLGAISQQNESQPQVIPLTLTHQLKHNLTRPAPKSYKKQNATKHKQAYSQASPNRPVPEREPNSEEREDADRSFLMSLLPDLKKLDDDQRLDFKVMTLQFFRDVRCKRKFPYSNAPLNYQFAAENGNDSSSEVPSHMNHPAPVVSSQTPVLNQAFLNFCAMMGQNSPDQSSKS